MPDRESVITHLQIIHTWAEFARERDLQFFTPMHLKDIAEWTDDTLELLKEQTTGHWIFLTDCSNSGVYCSECNTKVFDSYPFKKKFSYFCPHCGTRMEGKTERR